MQFITMMMSELQVTCIVIQVLSEWLEHWQPGHRSAGRGLHQLPLLNADRILLWRPGLAAGRPRWQHHPALPPVPPQPLPHPPGAVHTPLGRCRGVFAGSCLSPNSRPLPSWRRHLAKVQQGRCKWKRPEYWKCWYSGLSSSLPVPSGRTHTYSHSHTHKLTNTNTYMWFKNGGKVHYREM